MLPKSHWQRAFSSLALASLLAAPFASAHKPTPEDHPKVQVAILLDTSSSMSGLISQAKTQLWKIVNTFVEAEQNGEVPTVEVALYEYGNSKLHSGEHWVRLVRPLTRDLDQLSEDLFSLTTNGGEEYCGAVIKRATQELDWDLDSDVYKAIFIAGNEPFTQGPIDPQKSARKASKFGIFVNTIHCGGEQAGLNGGWKSGAIVADGSFLNIDQNKQIVHIEAPQDQRIIELNIELNTTYIPMGDKGRKAWGRQKTQDDFARENAKSGAFLNRAVTKSTSNYYNGSWDLVDASGGKGFDWSKVKEKDLPKEYRGLTPKEKQEAVEKVRRKRVEIQGEIQKLNKERLSYIAEKEKVQTELGEQTLDDAMVKTVREQAVKRGYKFARK